VLDGFEHSASTVLSQKFHEVTKYMALTRHMLAPFVMTCSMKEWNGLTEKEKSVVLSAAALARDIERGLAPIKEAEAMTGLKAKGMVIHALDTTAFRSAAIPIQDKLAQERGAADLLKLIRAAQ
jgi:TRAP-type C4-dicarboxylate transport system substrate-binding protein